MAEPSCQVPVYHPKGASILRDVYRHWWLLQQLHEAQFEMFQRYARETPEERLRSLIAEADS